MSKNNPNYCMRALGLVAICSVWIQFACAQSDRPFVSSSATAASETSTNTTIPITPLSPVIPVAPATPHAGEVPTPTPPSSPPTGGGSPTSFVGELLTQPTYIPGNYAVTPQPFPDANWVIGRKYPGYPVYGLYTYPGSYKKYRNDIKSVGWKYLRMGGAPTEADMLMLMEDRIEASFHIADSAPPSEFPTEEAFLSAAEQQAVTTLEKYGPGGWFFQTHPEHSAKHIKFVHIWNEPNFHYLINTSSVLPANQTQKAILYGKLALRVAGVIKSRWPLVTVLGFDTGRANPNSTDFMEEVFEHYPTLYDLFGIIVTHPGVDPVPPETDHVNSWGRYSMASNTDEIRNILNAQGGNKPIWFTEGGWKISQSNGGLYPSSPELTVSPELQAAYATRYYATALRLGVDRVAQFFIVDANLQNGGFFNDLIGAWRLSALAVQNMIAKMPAPKLMEVLSDGENGLFVYRFRPDAKVISQDRIIMAWNVEGPKAIKLNLNATQIQITDMLGGTATVSGIGTFDVEVGPCPIFIKEI